MLQLLTLVNFAPEQGGRLADQRRGQCPANSHLEGKLCVCVHGSRWTGAACAAVPVRP